MTKKIGQIEGAGNTKTAPIKGDSERKFWFLTWNNYSLGDIINLEKWCKENCDIYVFQEEKGDHTGTPHLQGQFNLKGRGKTFKYMCRNFEGAHWEPTKHKDAAMEYCMKARTRAGKVYTNIRIPKSKSLDYSINDEIDVLSEDKFYWWQKEIIEIISKKPDKRTIHWYWDETGNAGKTTFSKYLSHEYEAIPIGGKKNDMLYMCAEFASMIYIMDIERSMEDYVSYGAIEKIKDGYYMCAKYESKPIIRPNPHIICFANFAPDESQLSEDRWHIVNISNKMQLEKIFRKK